MAHVSARNGQHQVNQHASIKRKIFDRGRLNDFTDSGLAGVEHLWRIDDLDRLFAGFNAQLKINCQTLGNLEVNVLVPGRKATSADHQLVVCRLQARNFV
jgi:hypothetical protein